MWPAAVRHATFAFADALQRSARLCTTPPKLHQRLCAGTAEQALQSACTSILAMCGMQSTCRHELSGSESAQRADSHGQRTETDSGTHPVRRTQHAAVMGQKEIDPGAAAELLHALAPHPVIGSCLLRTSLLTAQRHVSDATSSGSFAASMAAVNRGAEALSLSAVRCRFRTCTCKEAVLQRGVGSDASNARFAMLSKGSRRAPGLSAQPKLDLVSWCVSSPTGVSSHQHCCKCAINDAGACGEHHRMDDPRGFTRHIANGY